MGCKNVLLVNYFAIYYGDEGKAMLNDGLIKKMIYYRRMQKETSSKIALSKKTPPIPVFPKNGVSYFSGPHTAPKGRVCLVP